MKPTPRIWFSLVAVLLVAAVFLLQGVDLGDGPSPADSVANNTAALAVQPSACTTSVAVARPVATATPAAATTTATATATAAATALPTATSKPTATSTPTPTPTFTSTPWPTGTVYPPATIGKALVVDQALQVLRVYEDGVEVRTLPASTGQAAYYTPAFAGRVRYYIGTFYSYGEWADDAWYVFMGAGEIMIHSLPYTKAGEEKIYTGQEHLGVRPSSHGCIRIHPDDAAWLTAWNPAGVPILITPPVVGKEW